MKKKKLVINIISLLTQFILDLRNSPDTLFSNKINNNLDHISKMHNNNMYNKQLYSHLIDKPQYGIQQKMNTKQNRLLKDQIILINFKLSQKATSDVSFIESWLIQTRKPQRKGNKLQMIKRNFDEELIYLLQEVLRGLKCQFLSQYLNMNQQFKSKYILDYEIQFNPKKKERKLTSLNYEHIWQKQAFIDEENILKVQCYNDQDKKFQLFRLQIKESLKTQSLHVQNINKNIKRGSQQTKPSNSGEYELTSSLDDNLSSLKSRKNAMIQFYDQDLNITVLSNDSDSFKKSTGKILNENILDGLNFEQQQDSDGQFQLLYDEECQKQNRPQPKMSNKILEIEQDFILLLKSMDNLLKTF